MSPRECCLPWFRLTMPRGRSDSVCASYQHLSIPHIGNLWLNTAILLVGSGAVNDGGYGAVKLSVVYTNEIVEVSVNKSVIKSNIHNINDKNNGMKEFYERVITKWESRTFTL